MYNNKGQLQKKYENIKTSNFMLHQDNLKPGIYFIELFRKNNKIGSLKFEILN